MLKVWKESNFIARGAAFNLRGGIGHVHKKYFYKNFSTC
jgi:hypothetical protein